MACALRIRGGRVVDGTGAPPREADVDLDGGRIVAVGEASGAAAREIDARGCWVTPGFVDPHTHLDAQLCWDPAATPSSRHGVTTVVMGLCGFGVAPCPEGGGEYLLRSLEVVEEIPYACTAAGVDFRWGQWRDYADFIARQPLGVNAAGYVPHSALRYFAMGERARKEPANADDRAAMLAELRDALAAGAVGLASSRGPNHVDGDREPVPSRLADAAEFEALVAACRGRIWQINVETKFSGDARALTSEVERYADWSRAGGARLTWSPFFAEPGDTVWREVLAHNQALNEAGTEVAPQITAVPLGLQLRFSEGSFVAAVPGWREPLAGFFERSPGERRARLSDPAVRAAMKAIPPDSKSPLTPDWERWRFTVVPTRPEWTGRSLAEVGEAENAHPVDVLCDQVLRDDFATLIDVPIMNRSREGAVRFLEDPHTLLGLGDAGAHVQSVTNYRYPTFLLAEIVRRDGLLRLERAVQQLTQVPARLHGLAGRGVLAPGAAADVCVIDPERIALGPVSMRHDLPGDAQRLYQEGVGYRAVFVNGVQTIAADAPTGEAPGVFLRVTD